MAAQGEHALAGVLAHARHLAAGDHRQRLLGDVLVLALVRVGEVDACARDADEHLAGAGLGFRRVDETEDLGPAELLDLDGAHGAGG